MLCFILKVLLFGFWFLVFWWSVFSASQSSCFAGVCECAHLHRLLGRSVGRSVGRLSFSFLRLLGAITSCIAV